MYHLPPVIVTYSDDNPGMTMHCTDYISKCLAPTNVVWILKNVNVTCLVYAEDMVLLELSHTALQELMWQCDLYAVNHSMINNIWTMVCMCVKPKLFRDLIVLPVNLNEEKMSVSAMLT